MGKKLAQCLQRVHRNLRFADGRLMDAGKALAEIANASKEDRSFGYAVDVSHGEFFLVKRDERKSVRIGKFYRSGAIAFQFEPYGNMLGELGEKKNELLMTVFEVCGISITMTR